MPDPSIRVRLRYPDVETFVEKFAPNVTRGGIFLPTKEVRAVGDKLLFEVQLADGKVMLAGEGKVNWVKVFSPAEPHKPFGLGVQFTSVHPSTRPVLERLLDRRAATGRRATVSVPVPVQGGASGAVRVDPAATTEFDHVEDSSLRRVLDRARTLSTRTDDLESLLKAEPDEAATLAQALQELPRYVSPSANGRRPTSMGIPIVPEVPPPSRSKESKSGPDDPDTSS